MSLVSVTMQKQIRKNHPINRNIVKLKRILTGKKARDPHKLYPNKYHVQTWVSKEDKIRINLLAGYKGITIKEAHSKLIF